MIHCSVLFVEAAHAFELRRYWTFGMLEFSGRILFVRMMRCQSLVLGGSVLDIFAVSIALFAGLLVDWILFDSLSTGLEVALIWLAHLFYANV